MRYPGRIEPGQVKSDLVSNLDVAPTILDTAGLAFSEPVDGESLIPLAVGDNPEWRDSALSETHGHGEDVIGRLVVTERYKYIAYQTQMHELYDLEKDPYELNNLIDDPSHGDILEQMREKLLMQQEKTKDGAKVL